MRHTSVHVLGPRGSGQSPATQQGLGSAALAPTERDGMRELKPYCNKPNVSFISVLLIFRFFFFFGGGGGQQINTVFMLEATVSVGLYLLNIYRKILFMKDVDSFEKMIAKKWSEYRLKRLDNMNLSYSKSESGVAGMIYLP